eukprot:m.342985 g.342985  ORF g.342985 m.342985 type:complete len:740 (-) comp19848_c1_seq1:86-2305(-)
MQGPDEYHLFLWHACSRDTHAYNMAPRLRSATMLNVVLAACLAALAAADGLGHRVYNGSSLWAPDSDFVAAVLAAESVTPQASNGVYSCSLCGKTSLQPTLVKTILYSGYSHFYDYGDEAYCNDNAHICMAEITVTFPASKIPTKQGLCLPSQCTAADLDAWWSCIEKNTTGWLDGLKPTVDKVCAIAKIPAAKCDAEFKTFVEQASATISATDTFFNCENRPARWEDISAAAVVVIAILVLLAIAVVTGEVLRRRRRAMELDDQDDMFPTTSSPSFVERLLIDVSLGKSFAELFGKSAKRTLNCLDSLRAISMFWIIYAHYTEFNITLRGADEPLGPIQTLKDTPTMVIFLFGQAAVDTFFFLSGMLSTYVLLKKADKGMRRFPVLKMVLLRYLRLTPQFAILIGIYASLVRYFGHGLQWYKYIAEMDRCKQYWWANLLYVNNFYPTNFHEQCVPWSWYLADDMQFFFIGLLVLFVYLRNRTAGVVLTSALVLTGAITTSALIKHHNLNFFSPEIQDITYSKPYTRIGAYAIGMLAAFMFLHKLDSGKKVVLKTWQSFCLLSLIVILLFALMYSVHDMFEPKVLPHGNWSSDQWIVYTMGIRIGLPMILTLLVTLCLSGNGGIIGEFLSLGFWEPLGKLTYAAYLIHPMIIRFYVYQQPSAYAVNMVQLDVTLTGTGTVTLAYLFATASFVLIEMPFAALVSTLMKKPSATPKPAPLAHSNGHDTQSLLPPRTNNIQN